MQSITESLGNEPIAYAIYYREPDGSREVDIYSIPWLAQAWEQMCLEDGCTEVRLVPLGTDEELSAVYRAYDFAAIAATSASRPASWV